VQHSVSDKPSHVASLEAVSRLGDLMRLDGHHNPEALAYALSRMFAGVGLRKRRVLEVGSGRGMISAYMALLGASRVVSMEPETVGSTSGVVDTQRRSLAAMGLADVVEVVPADFNTWHSDDRFDVIVSRASLNHIYPAEKNAGSDPQTRAGYLAVARRVLELLEPGGVFVATDANRYSLFGLGRVIGLRRPWRRRRSGVNWRHHQNARVWRSILLEAGFSEVRISYPVSHKLRHVSALVNNAGVNFLLQGSFIIHARK
jgi:SAM-dependent methyltransferase